MELPPDAWFSDLRLVVGRGGCNPIKQWGNVWCSISIREHNTYPHLLEGGVPLDCLGKACAGELRIDLTEGC